MITNVKVKDPVQNQVARKIVLVKVLHDQNGTCCVSIHKGVSTEKGGKWRGKINRMKRGETKKERNEVLYSKNRFSVKEVNGAFEVITNWSRRISSISRFSTSNKIIVSFLMSFFDDNVLQESTLSMRKRMESRSL